MAVVVRRLGNYSALARVSCTRRYKFGGHLRVQYKTINRFFFFFILRDIMTPPMERFVFLSGPNDFHRCRQPRNNAKTTVVRHDTTV